MAEPLLKVSGLSAGTEDKTILHDIDLTVAAGECHVLMGPNGAGKSTLGHVIMGDPQYKVGVGSIEFDGTDVTGLAADKRSVAGIFLSYQAPVEVPGVPLNSYLRTICDKRPQLKMKSRQFRARVAELADQLDMDPSYLDRELNVGFSGLDVDALSIVSRGIEAYRQQCDGALLVITHNTRILERLDVDRTHVMVKGNLVAEGGADLIPTIDREGFEQFEARLGQEDA